MSAIKEKRQYNQKSSGRSKFTFGLTSEGCFYIYPKKERRKKHSRQKGIISAKILSRHDLACLGN